MKAIYQFLFTNAFFACILTTTYGQSGDVIDARTQKPFQTNPRVVEEMGKLNYSIPLFNIESDGVSFPISLNYDGGGIKVESQASWVGQGWELSAGGQIDRLENGHPDDAMSFAEYGGGVLLKGYLQNDWEIQSHPTGSANYEVDPLAINNIIDLSPDFYSVHTSGIQGKFLIRRSGDLLPANQTSLSTVSYIDLTKTMSSISASTNENRRISAFNLTSLSGVKYLFNDVQVSIKDLKEDVLDYSYYSAWLLSEVQNKYGRSVFQIDYHPPQDYVYKKFSRVKSHNYVLNGTPDISSSENVTNLKKKYIKKVHYNEGYIEFVLASEEREDASDKHALQFIRRYDNLDNLIFEYELLYEYIGVINPRLFLTGVIRKFYPDFVGADTLRFDYDENVLPEMNSLKADHWGYYNGQDYTVLGSPLPEVSSNWTSDNRIIRQFDGNDDDRDSYLFYTRAGSLKKISFPEGKTLEFEYELNEYSFTGDIDNPVEFQHPTGELHSFSTYDGDEWNSSKYLGDFVEDPQWVKIRYSKNGCIEDDIAKLSPYIGIESDVKYLVSDMDYWVYLLPGETYSVARDWTVPISPCDTSVQAPTVQVLHRTNEPNSALSYRKKAGGLRIKSITTSDQNGNVTKRNFKYDKFGDTLRSSGIIAATPNTLFNSGQYEIGGLYYPIHSQSSSTTSAGFHRSNSVYYTNIEEYVTTVDAQGNTTSDSRTIVGRTLKEYHFTPIEIRTTSYPFLPIMAGESRRILLHRIKNIDTGGELVSETIYNYETLTSFASEEVLGNIASKIQWNGNDDDHGHHDLMWCRRYSFKHSPEVTRLKKLTQVSYSEDIPHVFKTEYKYLNDHKYANVRTEEAVVLPDSSQLGNTKLYNYNLSANSDLNIPSICGTNNIDLSSSAYQCALNNLLSNSGQFESIGSIKWRVPKLGENDTTVSEVRVNFLGTNNGNIVPRKTVAKTAQNVSWQEAIYDLYEIVEENKVVEYTQHDRYERNIETANSNGEFSSRLIDHSSRVSAEINNGEYYSSRYTSFEHDYHGGWNPNEDFIHLPNPITYVPSGQLYYRLTESSSFNSILVGDYTEEEKKLPAGTYLLSYWTRKGQVVTHVGNGNVLKESSVQKGDWTYHEKVINWPDDGNWITLALADGDPYEQAHLDELRLHEIDATMNTKGYYPDGKVMFEGDPGSRIINYEYDSKSRLEWVLDEEKHVIKHYEYEEKDPADVDSYNVRRTYTPVRENMTKQDVLNASATDTDVKRRTEYSDGLGRFRQAVDAGVHDGGYSRVTFSEYDPFGRELKKYLPYYSNDTDLFYGDGNYVHDAKAQQSAYYADRFDPQQETGAPYQETVLESSPLQRPVEKGGVGEELQPGTGHTTRFEYGYNTADDKVLVWQLTGETASSNWSFYAPGTLKKTTSISPDGDTATVFTDAHGRKVARRVSATMGVDADGNLATGPVELTDYTHRKPISYTIYDDYDRPVFEIPAIAVERMNGDYQVSANATIGVGAELVTHYRYDDKGRLSVKKTPGQGNVRYVYDYKDRIILTQDQQQFEDDRWSFVKYDTRGRVVLKGEVTSPYDRATHQANADANPTDGERFSATGGTVFGYTTDTYPAISESDVLNVYYFDGYDFDYPPAFDFAPFDTVNAHTQMTRGLATGSKTRMLLAAGSWGGMLTTVSWYDDDQRPIQAFTENHLGGHDRIDTYYNDRGQTAKTIQHHQYDPSSESHTFATRFVYDDHGGQLVGTYCKLDDDPEVRVSRHKYDIDGKLYEKALHQPPGVNDNLQTIDYRYNDQGRLTHINNTALIVDAFNADADDVFGQELTYFDDSPEYDSSNPWNKPVVAQYGGNVSSMMWNAKTPEEDGAELRRYAYVYDYDDFGQMSKADFLFDRPENPGLFQDFPNMPLVHDVAVNYDLGGNITRLNRSQLIYPDTGASSLTTRMDELTYTYDDSYRLKKVLDAGETASTASYKHFVDGADLSVEYVYDASGKMITDRNRDMDFEYNALGLPRRVVGPSQIRYLYDAAGNKLQKQVETFGCPPQMQCPPPSTDTTDYVGNFVYQDGQLVMVYHPEGVIRPTPPSAENTTDYVYDYFIKDYLGNVRVVLTEENATYDTSIVATMEQYRAAWEEDNFNGIGEGREPKPFGYPIDASFPFNHYIAQVVAENDMTIGPSKVMEVNRGERVKLATRYFFQEDAPGTTYDGLGFLVEEILVSMAASGAGVLPVGENALINLANGNTSIGTSIFQFLSNEMDTTDMTRPHGYLVWLSYDRDFKLDPASSGALRVVNPNELGTLLSGEIPINETGYLHVYVANGTQGKAINFDNLYITTMQGKTRQINHYYPYGLRMRMGHGKRYNNMYTGKELQTGEYWDASVSTGLEMYDFDARFYDPQLGRWFTPDPAEQFHNPYLGIGNNPITFTDPDGEFIFAAIGIGLTMGAISGYSAGKARGATGSALLGYTFLGGIIGGTGAFIGAGAGAGVAAGFAEGANLATVYSVSGAVGAFEGGALTSMGQSLLAGNDFGSSALEGLKAGVINAGIAAGIGAITGGLAQSQINQTNADIERLLARVDDDYYYHKLIADANANGIYYAGSEEFPTVDFSSNDVVADVIRQWKMIKVHGRYGTYGDWFDANTISKSDGWELSGAGTSNFGWRKNFTWNGNKVMLYAAPASVHHYKLVGFHSSNTRLGRQFGLVSTNKQNVIFLNFASRLQFDAVRNSIMSSWAPGFRHAPIIIKPDQDYKPLQPWQR